MLFDAKVVRRASVTGSSEQTERNTKLVTLIRGDVQAAARRSVPKFASAVRLKKKNRKGS
jgi:hypothetical protein